MSNAKNVLGQPLQSCSVDPMTGFFRDGCCRSGAEDIGLHLVCSVMTDEFLAFSKSRGNDLTTPVPQFRFPGLKAGDRWCLCVLRWKEAFEAGLAPKIVLESTHISTLEFVDLEDLQRHSIEA
ncbi:MAG: DUF2237 family protein [Pirellula sp.]|jgi:uncharacterized protein (DUF2237 family)